MFLVGLTAKMVRNYVRKSDRGNVSEETMKAAVLEVKLKKKSIRGVAQHYGIPRKTLGRYCDKYEGLVQSLNQPSILDSPKSIKETLVAPTSEVQPSSIAPVSKVNVKPWVEFGYTKPRQVRVFFKPLTMPLIETILAYV